MRAFLRQHSADRPKVQSVCQRWREEQTITTSDDTFPQPHWPDAGCWILYRRSAARRRARERGTLWSLQPTHLNAPTKPVCLDAFGRYSARYKLAFWVLRGKKRCAKPQISGASTRTWINGRFALVAMGWSGHGSPWLPEGIRNEPDHHWRGQRDHGQNGRRWRWSSHSGV